MSSRPRCPRFVTGAAFAPPAPSPGFPGIPPSSTDRGDDARARREPTVDTTRLCREARARHLAVQESAFWRLPGRYDAGKSQGSGDLRRKNDQLQTEHVPNSGSGDRDNTGNEAIFDSGRAVFILY